MESVKITDNYFLVKKPVNRDQNQSKVISNTNHIFVVDVSGSMSWDLSLIRKQLKNKLSEIMNDNDTISIIWFSGDNESGILKEEVEIKSLKTLTDLHNAIDKWLKPIGLTAFRKPLELVSELVDRMKKNKPDSIFSLIFLTDGYNNDCSWSDVKENLRKLETDIHVSTFVEYGFNADSKALTEMACILGGEKISCSNFEDYDLMLTQKLSTKYSGGKKITIDIYESYLYDFAFSISNDSITMYGITNNSILVNNDVDSIYFFSSDMHGKLIERIDDSIIYGGIYILSDKLMSDDAEKLFYILGDQYYYNMLNKSYGKQKLNEFKNSIKTCVSSPEKRFIGGRVKITPVNDNAYCLMNLIRDLGGIDQCVFYPNHPDFKYNRIGRKRKKMIDFLTDSDKERLSNVTYIDDVFEIYQELKDRKPEIKFVEDTQKGYSLSDLVWNEERANLSIRIRIDGDLYLPKNDFNVDKIPSFKYKTFTIIADGIVNIKTLPVKYSDDLYKILVDNGVEFYFDNYLYNNEKILIINLNSLPIINRSMIKSISARTLGKLEWDLIRLQADKKVYDYYYKKLFPKTSESFLREYGAEFTEWVKELGVTDYNGFAPKTIAEESSDYYMSVNLITKIKGLSSLPKVEDVINKINSGKELKISEWIMSDAIIKYDRQINSDLYRTLTDEQQKMVLNTYLKTNYDLLNKSKKEVMQKIAELKFSIILSKKWFNEFKSFDENEIDLTLDNKLINFKFELVEKMEKI